MASANVATTVSPTYAREVGPAHPLLHETPSAFWMTSASSSVFHRTEAGCIFLGGAMSVLD